MFTYLGKIPFTTTGVDVTAGVCWSNGINEEKIISRISQVMTELVVRHTSESDTGLTVFKPRARFIESRVSNH